MSEIISSLQNPRIKRAAKLRQRRQRARQRRTLIDGVREVNRALDGLVHLNELFYCGRFCDSAQGMFTVERARQRGIETIETTPRVFEKLAYGARSEGLVAVATVAEPRLDEVEFDPGRVVAVVEGIEKPGNLGAILRSADAAGLGGLIVVDGRTDLYNPNVIRASLGTVFTVPLGIATGPEALAWLLERNRTIHAARVGARRDYTECDLTPPAAILLGSEAEGLSLLWSGDKVTDLSLPMCGVADSLNVSVTAAVLFYESRRQCRAARG